MNLWSGQQQSGYDCVTVDRAYAFSVRLGAEDGAVSPRFDWSSQGHGQSPPLAWELPGLGCGSTLSLGAPWMGIWVSSSPCQPGPH